MAKPEKKIMIVDGRVFRIKKKWNELSREQKRWILADAKFYYDKMTVKTVCPLTSTKKRELLHKVFQRVRAKGIWIPFDEVGRVVSSRIRKWNDRMTRYQVGSVSQTKEKKTIE